MEGSASKLLQVGVGKVWLLTTLNRDVIAAFSQEERYDRKQESEMSIKQESLIFGTKNWE